MPCSAASARPDLTDDEVAAIQATSARHRARVDEIEAQIERLTTEAIAAIERAEVTDEARAALVELAHFVAWRET